MLWRASLAAALLCVGCICNCEQAALVSRVVLPREYRLELCGRALIRAIIITCGGSWSRRSTHLGESLPVEFPERHYGRGQLALEVSQPSSETRGQQAATERPAANRRRRRRLFSQGLTYKCCFQGCNKNDIRHLC
uniref:Insulin n=1 Tax=Mola mola TaxID=94237 RepID=A0A3Q4BZQ9_MOLML